MLSEVWHRDCIGCFGWLGLRDWEVGRRKSLSCPVRDTAAQLIRKSRGGAWPPPGRKLVEKGEGFMKVKPLADRILAKRLDPEETVKGGIIIPDTAKEKPLEAQVIAVGPGKVDDNGKRIPMEVKKGQRILVGKYSGTDVKIGGEEHIILREDDVLGIIE